MNEAQEMDEAQTIELFEATDRAGVGLRNVFILGSLRDPAEQIAVSRQQQRAINLIHALRSTGRLAKGMRLCVVGAGAAGLTAAALAHHHGVHTTVLESREPLWNLRGCRTRWLHPNLFALWPHPGWDVTATNFPVMNWYAGYADHVGELLWAKYKSYVPAGEPCVRIHDASLQVTATDGRVRVAWRKRGEIPLDGDAMFDALVVAVGFGAESRRRDAASSEYWLDDALERPNPHGCVTRYLVSGTGDGGLTDLLRLRLKAFRHHHLRDLLVSLPRDVVDAVRQIEDERGKAYREASTRDDKAAMAAIDRGLTDDLQQLCRRIPAFPRVLRDDTQVLLVDRREAPLSPGRAWPVSRFLTAALLACDSSATEYRSVGPAGVKVTPIVGDDGLAPSEFRVAIDGRDETVHAVVFRHGTTPVIYELLRRWDVAPETMAAIAAKWTQAWKDHGSTAAALLKGPSRDNRYRAKDWHARPAVAGRTPIGLLSRLVAQVDPDLLVSSDLVIPEHVHVTACVDLVTDDMAHWVTPIDSLRGNDDLLASWRLSGKIGHQEVLDAIRWLDQGLDRLHMPGQLDAHLEELEHHWVLPRFEWLPPAPPGALLIHTCVARCWKSRRLRYLRRSQQEALSLVPERDEFIVVDLDDLPARVAVVQDVAEQRSDNRRLARQLCVTHFCNSHGLQEIGDL